MLWFWLTFIDQCRPFLEQVLKQEHEESRIAVNSRSIVTGSTSQESHRLRKGKNLKLSARDNTPFLVLPLQVTLFAFQRRHHPGCSPCRVRVACHQHRIPQYSRAMSQKLICMCFRGKQTQRVHTLGKSVVQVGRGHYSPPTTFSLKCSILAFGRHLSL